ncbi:NAD(P)H-dependent oxidoreductase [Spirosoma sp. KUDC1026]|uniref:NAD(P)H-dependent oxidoreductase n=1 Tax=Spirosoma sp. KUDC1026 TaxID=2745947 RepID=UPI00159BCA35|nr:NAD(P)H-dependent oxidoreductase [Spirosoma sp. KUDC1026]QKZ11346.1 NAD(P)H-dependent oxidoreductase [Spirosoma sp. KUDC1026]
MELLDAMNWRYAAKRMNGQPVPEEKLNTILEAIRLSASSVGLQPYNVIVTDSHELKGKIHQLACPQPQVVEASHILIFAAWTSLEAEHIDRYIQLIADTRKTSADTLTPFADSIKGSLLTMDDEQRYNWAARQSYIGLGSALIAAAVEKVDATPMEGFNGSALDELLDLPAKGLKSIAILALGYRDAENDFLAKAAKVRRPAEDFFLEMA